ncbi:MAG TPA: MFS transporter [Candidatus Binatus sp.]|nr:MFS transporter [Candidatus Binatus sp.]
MPLDTRPSFSNQFPAPPEAVPARLQGIIYSGAFANLGIGYLIVYITGYMPAIGIKTSSIGLLIGVFGLVPILTGIPLGMLSDRKGRKTLLLLGSFGIFPALTIFALTTNLSYLMISAVLLGLSEAASLTTWNAIIADQTTTQNRTKAFSLSFIISTVFIGLGSAIPITFPYLQQVLHLDSTTVHTDLMWAVSFLSLASPLLLLFLLRDYREVIRPLQKRSRETRGNLRTLLKFSGINSLIGLGAGFIVPLIPTWFFLKFGVADTYSGPLLAVSQITIGMSAIGSARLSKTYGPVRAIVLTTGLSTVFMLSLAFVNNAALAAGLYIIRAALMNMASPLMDSYLMGIITPEQRGLASAINSIIWRLPNSVSTIAGGIILGAGSYSLPFILAASLYATAVILFFSVFRNVTPRIEIETIIREEPGLSLEIQEP